MKFSPLWRSCKACAGQFECQEMSRKQFLTPHSAEYCFLYINVTYSIYRLTQECNSNVIQRMIFIGSNSAARCELAHIQIQ